MKLHLFSFRNNISTCFTSYRGTQQKSFSPSYLEIGVLAAEMWICSMRLMHMLTIMQNSSTCTYILMFYYYNHKTIIEYM